MGLIRFNDASKPDRNASQKEREIFGEFSARPQEHPGAAQRCTF